MRYLSLVSCFLVSAMLAACAPGGMRMVDAVDGNAFTTMSRAMHGEMLRRNLVDSRGSWYSPVFSFGPFRAGEKLVDRLSPRFRFPRAGVAVPDTFRGMMGEDARLVLRGPVAVIEQGISRVELRLLAVADWNGDGKDDWLVRCRVGTATEPKKYRDYYLAVLDRKRPVWEPKLLMVLDHVYGRVIPVGDPSRGALAESLSTDYLQGQSTILEAPGKSGGTSGANDGSKLRTSRLAD